MLGKVATSIGLTSLSTIILSAGAQAHTTGTPHPHPHSMDLFAAEGAATLALMFIAFGLLFVAHRAVQSKRNPARTKRGKQ